MIHGIWSTLPSFREVSFTSGMNVILADRADDSGETESTNGLGKTTLLRVIHFCLGSELGKDKVLTHPKLKDAAFGMSFSHGELRVQVLRSIGSAKSIWVTTEFLDGTAYSADATANDLSRISIDDYRLLLSKRFIKDDDHNAPSFREIAHYLIRVGKPAYTDPTTVYQGQTGISKRLCSSYLLGLNWSGQQALHVLLESRKQVDFAIKTLQQAEVASGQRTIGELEAERVALQVANAAKRAEVENFNVRDDYNDLQVRLAQVDRQLHDLINDNHSDSRLLQHYIQSAKELPEADPQQPIAILQSAGAVFREEVLKKLEDVAAFHSEIHRNRAEFLRAEIKRLSVLVGQRKSRIDDLAGKKTDILQLLKTSGALETLIELQRSYTEQLSQYESLNARLAERKRFDLRKDELSASIAHERALMKRDLDDRQRTLDEARILFAEYTQFLYGKAGGLSVDVNAAGYTFTFSIDREGSDGVDQMVVFCFDLVVATLTARRKGRFLALAHDSTLFADVDPRQYGLALQLASATALKEGFQYVCCLNSGALPLEQLGSLDLEPLTRLRLTDEGESGRLLGIRLPPRDGQK